MASDALGAVPEDEASDSAKEDLEPESIVQQVSSVPSIPRNSNPGTANSRLSPLPWQDYFDESKDIVIPESGNVFHVYLAGTEGPVVFCLHGGGYSGLSFALVAQKMKVKVRVVAMDIRGHGLSHTNDDLDLSAATLCADVINVIRIMYGNEPPPIVLVGHSMGGAIAVRIAAKRTLRTLSGLVVVDVVEGSAMSSLMHMQKILSSRPSCFSSIEKAIQWSVKVGSLRNVESARISVPSTLKFDEERNCYVWLTQLERSESYWKGWYEGLSELFLSCPVPKLLLLAGTDRLDRSLTIGQMQGKFQMVLIRHSGHAIQEDEPDEFSATILGFVSRNRIGPHGVEIPGLQRRSTS